MRKIDVALKVAEKHSQIEMDSAIGAKMKASVQDIGKVGGLRHTILTHIASESYDLAIKDLKAYSDSKAEYPQFADRSARYINYAVDLVNAVKAKRSFPGLKFLSTAKQQELLERALVHFEDLKATLKKIEQIEREVKIEDVRSTVWVVRAVVYCAFALLAVGLVTELSKGLLPSAHALFESYSNDLVNWIFDKLGL